MGRYFRYLIKKIFRKKETPKELVKVKEIENKLIEIADAGSSFDGGTVIGSVMAAIIGIIGLLIYSSVFSALNTAAISGATESMLGVVPVVIAAVIVISIAMGGFSVLTRW